ncbi:MAG: polysaccharide biosynthesis tyrosine autokinase [Desulfobaccales bacterium]
MSSHDQHPLMVPPSGAPLPFTPPLPPLDYYDAESQGPGLQDYLFILLKRKWLIIGTFLTIFLIVALYTFSRTPIFRAAATLQITEDNPASQVSLDNKLSRLTGNDALEKFQQTQYEILQSRSLAQRVIQALNLAGHPDFKRIKEKHPDKSENEINNLMVDAFLKKLAITPVHNSYLVEVAFQSHDKTMAQRVVNAIADQYMFLSIDRRNESFALVRTWLDKQLKEMAAKVQEAQKKLYQFGQKTDIYTLEDRDNVVIQKFIDLSSLVTRAQAEKMAKEAQFKQIKGEGPDAPLIVNNPLIATLRQQLVSQQTKVSAMKKVYRREFPALMSEEASLAELRGRLNSEVQRMQESIKADYEAANRTEKLLNDSFADQKGQMAKLQDNLTDFQILKRDAQTNEQLYQALLARVKEASIAGTMVPSNVAVIDPAPLPNMPFKPKTGRDLALGAILGLTLGLGLAFLLEHLDDSIRSIDDLERTCNLPSLGMLPLLSGNGKKLLGRREKPGEKGIRRYLPRLRRRGQAFADAENGDLIVFQNPQSPASEAIRHAHTAIMLSASGRPPAAIMVTSPNPSEGKTLVASNLALTFALGGHQTLLIDCDLRKPRMHQIFQMGLQPGLSNYLTGGATLEEILRPASVPNLSVLSAGTRPPSPGILLDSQEFKDLLGQLRERFKHIIIDTPPILAFSEGLIISVLTDGVIMVTRHNCTHKNAAHLAHQRLTQIRAPLMGAVLNCVDSYGQACGGYNYKYYSKYYDGDS